MKRKSILKKPLVFKKMLQYRDKVKRREYALQLIELNYNNKCNFSCEYCFAKYLNSNERKLSIRDVKRLADQADEIGVWQWHFQGGEVLLWNDLDEIVDAIDPKRFHIMVTTNGYLLTQQKAKHLSGIGIDKVSISLDSFNEESHDKIRNKVGSYKKVIEALFYAKEAGLQVNINIVITKQNVRGQEIIDIVKFAEKNGFTILFVIVTPVGNWAGRTDILIDESDAEYIKELKKRYPFIHRDLYPLFDFEWGCRTMNGLVYITEDGDLLSCPFIHISIGNVIDEPLIDILKRGWRVKYFRDYNSKCLAGEDLFFIRNYISKTYERKGPIPFNEAFCKDDLYD